MEPVENQTQLKEKPRYRSVDLLKAACVVGIFCWHADILTGPTDWGARFSEVFFACSGVMEGLLHFGRYQHTISESVKMLERKLRRIWPLHIVMLLLASLIASHGVGLWRVSDQPTVALINAMLCQSWFKSISFSFNGSSWFLSSLGFCWLMTPFLDWCISELNRLTGHRRASIVVIGCTLLILYVFLSIADQEGIISVGYYTYPPIRFCAYGFAYAVGCLIQLFLAEGFGSSFTPLEVFPIVLWVAVAVLVQQFSAVHVLAATLLVTSLVVFKGRLDGFCDFLPLKLISSYQLPFFLSQEMCIRLFMLPRAVMLIPAVALRNLGAFVTCLCFCACWNSLNLILGRHLKHVVS